MSTENANQPAFPQQPNDNPVLQGLSKRELIAAMAMQGLLANPNWFKMISDNNNTTVAKVSTNIADTLLTHLQKQSHE